MEMRGKKIKSGDGQTGKEEEVNHNKKRNGNERREKLRIIGREMM